MAGEKPGGLQVSADDALAVLEGRMASPLDRRAAGSRTSVATGPPTSLVLERAEGASPVADGEHDQPDAFKMLARPDPALPVGAPLVPQRDVLALGQQLSPIGLLIAEGEHLLGQLHTQEGDVLLNAMLRSSTPGAASLRSRVSTPHVEGGSEEAAEVPMAAVAQTFDQLIVEAGELAVQLPDTSVKELLTAIERGSTPIAQAVRSRVQTPMLQGREANLQDRGQGLSIPLLDVDRVRLLNTTESVLSLLTERTRSNLGMLEKEGKALLEHIDDASRAAIGDTLVSQALLPTRPIAFLLLSAFLQNREGAVQSSSRSDDAARLQDLVDDAGNILAALNEAVASGKQTEQRTAMLSKLQEMAGHENGSLVARMLYFDMMVSFRSIAEGDSVDGSMTERSRGQFGELVEQGAQLITNLEHQHARSVLDSITAGAVSNRCMRPICCSLWPQFSGQIVLTGFSWQRLGLCPISAVVAED